MKTSDLETPFISNKDPKIVASRLLQGYYVMCICFSFNLSTVTTVIAFASADFPTVGNYSTGTLFGTYCLTALFFGAGIIKVLGLKRSLVAGLSQYMCYNIMFVIASFGGNSSYNFLIVIGAAVGGVASGYLWVAQGGYFTECAKRYASLTLPLAAGNGEEEEEHRQKVTGSFASYFATIYLACEVSFKFIGSLIKQLAGDSGTKIMYLVFTVICGMSVVGMTTIPELCTDDEKKSDSEPTVVATVCTKVLAALRLLATDFRMVLLLPFEFSFGLLGALLNGYISPHILAQKQNPSSPLPATYIGYFAGIVAGVACVVSKAGGEFINRTGKKWPVMMLGSLCFGALAGSLLLYSNEDLSNLSAFFAMYALMGVGRGVFESCNKAVISDMFADNAPAAFANVVWSSGGSSALGFLVMAKQAREVQAGVAFLSAIAGLTCYLIAHGLSKSKQRTTT